MPPSPSQSPLIYVAGHRGMVGSAIVRQLLAQGHPAHRIVTRTHAELDLTDQAAVRAFFQQEKPDQVYLAAAKVAGIHANNTYPAEFIHQNLMIQANVIDAAFRNGVRKLLFLGSSCIDPKLCESYNRQYGASHGVDYRSVMPTNLYGPGDTIWGSGTPRREFLHVDDMAAACVHVMSLDKPTYDQHIQPMLSHIHVGCGEDVKLRELSESIARTVNEEPVPSSKLGSRIAARFADVGLTEALPGRECYAS